MAKFVSVGAAHHFGQYLYMLAVKARSCGVDMLVANLFEFVSAGASRHFGQYL